jgi:porin
VLREPVVQTRWTLLIAVALVTGVAPGQEAGRGTPPGDAAASAGGNPAASAGGVPPGARRPADGSPGGGTPSRPDPDNPAAPPGEGGDARPGSVAVSANPAAVNIVTGTGALGRLLGIGDDTGIRLGGLWVGDASGVLSGGLSPGRWGLNSLTIADLSFDTEKLFDWKGGLLGTQFLQFSGQPTNELAGAFPGFNSLEVTPPLVRQELYQLWFRQTFFDDRLIVRIGKTVPTFDFNNVVKPVPVKDASAVIPAVTGLIYTPIFVNPTILGKIPGYYNSATGLTASLAPTEHLYLSYGFYDGNLALGRQTGLEGPHFNGYYFHIGEVGYAYRVGSDRKPGNIGVGGWGQTGKLKDFNGATVRGTGGVYLFGAQRLWFRHPGRDNSGVSGFYQFGANNSNAMLARQYFGAGLTGFGLVPGRPDDSLGFGLAWTWLNRQDGAGHAFFPGAPPGPLQLRPSQLMFSWYYQMKLFDGWFFQPNLTYIPTPGENGAIPSALALTFRLIVLF